ncbi:endo-1,4-beta-xylanase [Moorena producens]|uniref:endo-1,4-beta-xylanase n=1 Tax=Moorena producens TaxID=1155739 RepID=UPI003C7693D3
MRRIFVQNPPKPEEIAANMKRLGELGLQVQVTEMDVKIHDGSGTQEERVAAQTQVYRDILQVCLEAPNCTAFLTWEFADHHSWIPDFFGKPDSPLPFDESYRPKTAYHAMVEVLKIDA